MAVKNIDFVVEWCDDPFELSARILYALFVQPLKGNMPCIVVCVAKSGRGKSYSVISMMDAIYTLMGIDLREYLTKSIIFNPIEYGEKTKALLYERSLKDLVFAQLDEARDLIGAKNWQKFINRVVPDVQATSRTIKPLTFFIVTQSILDVTKDVRRQIDYYAVFSRKKHGPAKMKLYEIYIDDRDVERPKLKKRRVYGIIRKDGIPLRTFPVFVFKRPRKELVDQYEPLNFEYKTAYIRRRLEELMQSLKKSLTTETEKVEAMVGFYVSNPNYLGNIVKMRGQKLHLVKDIRKLHDLTEVEEKMFKEKLEKRLIEDGVVSDGQVESEK